MIGELENLLLGLENRPGDPGTLPMEIRGVTPDPAPATFLFEFNNGPLLVSKGSGFSESRPTTGSFFISLNLAFFQLLILLLSLLMLINFHGSMLARNACFLVKVRGSGSPSILMDNLGVL